MSVTGKTAIVTGAGAHAVEEWVDLASAHRVAGVLEAVARDFCR